VVFTFVQACSLERVCLELDNTNTIYPHLDDSEPIYGAFKYSSNPWRSFPYTGAVRAGGPPGKSTLVTLDARGLLGLFGLLGLAVRAHR
jgi:hypothetical protein